MKIVEKRDDMIELFLLFNELCSGVSELALTGDRSSEFSVFVRPAKQRIIAIEFGRYIGMDYCLSLIFR